MEESGLNQEHHPDAANLKDIVPNGIKTNPFITPSIIHQPPEDVRFGEQDFRQLEYHVPPVQNEPNYNGPYREQGKDPLTPQQPYSAALFGVHGGVTPETESKSLDIDPHLEKDIESLAKSPKERNKDSLDRIMMPPPPPPTTAGSKRPASPAASRGVKKTKGKARGDNVYDDADAVLEDPKSPLYKDNLNLKAVLQHPNAKSALSHDGEYAFDNVSTDELATAAAAFQEDGRSGRHDPEWVRQAMVASSRRQAGDFDGHNAQKFQGIWAEDNEQLSDTDDEAAADENEAMDIDPLQDIRYDHNGRDPRSDDDDDNAPSASRTHQNHSVGNSANSNNSADSSNNGNGSQSQPVDTHPLNQNETSNQVVNRSDFPPPPRCQIIDVTSDAKMEHLFRKSSFLEQLILKVGDVFRAEIGGVSKDAKVTGWFGLAERTDGKALSWSQGGRAFLELEIPPGNHSTSEPLARKDITFPNDGFTSFITGPIQIIDAMRYAMNAVKYQKSASAGGHWDRIDVYRGEEHLGNLYDIRQALIFAQNEYDFHCQLKFIHGRPRRVHKGQQTEGYRSVEGSGLYRKIRRDDFPRHNHDLIIDLGDELNDSLAACAHDGFMIVMCDMRMLNNDGIPTPKGTGIETVYEQGPDSFPTLFARDLASVYGWSKGYAHIGPLGLGKGWSTGLWSRGRGMTSAPHAVRKEQDPNSWLDYFAVKQELTPKGCVWTEEEISRVKAFHQANIAGRIEHFPFPITMGMRSKPAPLSTNKFGNPAVPITRKVSPVRIAHKARPVEAVSNSRPTGDSTPTATVEENLPQPCHIDRPAIAQPLDHAGFPAQSHAPLDQIDIAHQALQVMANPSPQSAMGTSRYHHDENPHTFASRDYDDGNHRSFHSGSQLAERTDKYHYEGMPRTSSWGAHYEGNHRSIIRTHSSISQNTVPQLPQPRLQPYSANMTWPVHRVDDTNTRYQQYVASAPQNTLQEMNQTAHQHDLGNAQGRLEFNQMYNFQPPETPGFRKRRRPRRSFAEIGERPYKCGWQGCDKAYDTLGNLNDHVGNKSHGPRRTRNVTTVNSTAGFAPIPAVYKYKCGWKGCHKSFPELRKLNNHINMFSHGPLPTPSGFPLLTDSDDPKSLYPEVPAQESPSSHESSEPESFGIGSDCSEYPQLENTTLFSQSPSLMSNGPRSFGMMNGITQRRQSDSPAPLAPTPYQGFGLDGCDDESAEKRGSADSGYRSQSPLLASSNSGKSPGTEGSQKKKRTGKSAIDEHDALNSESRKSGFAAKGTKPLQAYYGRRSEPSSIAAGPTASFFGTVTQLGPPAPQSSVFPLSSGFLRQTEEDLYASITSNPPVRDQVNSDRAANDYTMQLSFEHMPQIFAPSHTSSLSSRPSRCLVPIDQWNMSQNIDPVLKNSAEPEYLAPAQVKQEHDLMHTESFTSPFSHSSSDYTTIPALPSHPMHPSPNSFGGNTVPRQSQGHNRPSSSAGSYPFFMPPAQIILEGNTANHPHGHSHLSRSSSSLLPTSIYSRKTSYESYRSARQPQAISYSHEELFGGPDSASTEPEPEKKPEYPDPDEAASPMPTSYFPTPSPPTVPSRSEIHPTLPERSPPRPPVQDLALLPKKRKSIPWEDQDYEENPKSKRKCK